MHAQQDHPLRNSQVICKAVIIGSYVLVAAIASLLLLSLVVDHNNEAPRRLLVCAGAFVYIGLAQALAQKHYTVTAYLLISFYLLLASGMVWTWGVNTPIAALTFGLVIVLAGILLRARHSLFAVGVSASILIATQLSINLGWHTPDTSWADDQSSLGDVIAYCVVFSMLALVSWLYNREMEGSLAKAKKAETALLQQKATLKLQVKERTAQLRLAQQEEMRQMYRFAQLGQLGVTLLHDLANHITALTIEIEGLQQKQPQGITRAQQITQYLEKIVDNTRDRLLGNPQNQTFNIIQTISETVDFLRYKARDAEVIIDWHPPAHSWPCTGDAISLSHVMAIIISNAIDAYETMPPTPERRVVVTMERTSTHIVIKTSDWGKGIAKNARKHLFKPFQSSKKAGLGLGLFIARQTAESNFSGSLTLNGRSEHTQLILKLPLQKS